MIVTSDCPVKIWSSKKHFSFVLLPLSNSINKLKIDGMAYEKDGAVWLNTDSSGDDKHRVLIREDGRATYFASASFLRA